MKPTSGKRKMNSEHPTYPNPTIQEAICEIHFRLSDDFDWKPALLGELYKHIEPDFPDLEPVTQVDFLFQVGPKGSGPMLRPSQQMMRYKHISRNLLIQFSKNILTVNVLPKYEGWEQMSADIFYAWGKVCGVIKPASITKIGLRYIDRIERTHPDEFPSEWLAPSDYIPKSALSSLPGFLYRLETRMNQDNKLIVTLGEPIDDSGRQSDAIVLDIDCIVEREIGVDNNAISQETEKLHDFAWQVFSASMTPRLERLLQGGE